MSNRDRSSGEANSASLTDFGGRGFSPPRYPSAFDEESGAFIQSLHSDVETLSELLIDSFPVCSRPSGLYIHFENADRSHFENFLQSNPRISVKASMIACQLTKTVAIEELGLQVLSRTYTDGMDIDVAHPGFQRFIGICSSCLSRTRHIESILLPYFRHREQHERSTEFYLYSEVQQRLSSDSFEISRGTDIPGTPNVVITESGVDHDEEDLEQFIAVTAVDSTRHEVMKRAKVALSRLRDTVEDRPDCTAVLFLRVRSFAINEGDESYKDKKRRQIKEMASGGVDTVYFMSEFDKFVQYCDSQL